MTARLLGRGIAALVLAGGLALGPALSASAADPTTTTFVAGASQTVAYGSSWVMTVQVSGKEDYETVEASSGTVDILVKGIAGYYATGLPLADNGEAFFAQPSSKPPLAAGTYSVTAVYVPGSGTFLSGSQTSTPATLTITPVALKSSFEVNKVLVGNDPALQVVAHVAAQGTSAVLPGGNWQVTAKGSSGAVAFSKSIATGKNPATPISVTLPKSVKPGQYTISANFVPTPDVAGGYQVTNGDPRQVTLDAQSIGATLSTPFAAPLWALIVVAAGFLLLIAAGIVLLATGRGKPVAPETAPTESIPAE